MKRLIMVALVALLSAGVASTSFAQGKATGQSASQTSGKATKQKKHKKAHKKSKKKHGHAAKTAK